MVKGKWSFRLALHVAGLCALAHFLAAALWGQATAPVDKAEALSQAARSGDAAAVKKLLDEGLDVDTKYRYDRTALSFACDRGHLEVVKVLLDHGASVNIKDTFYGATPLEWASSPAMGRKPQHAEIVGLLLKHGAQGKEDAFANAVSAGDTAMIKVILDQGPLEPKVLSEALESAQKDKKPDIVAMLELAGAKPYAEFKIEEKQLQRYAGTYREPRGNEMVFTVKDGQLTGGPQMALAATDATTFRIVGFPGATLKFNLGEGKPAEVTFSRGEMKTTYTRVADK